MKLSPNYSSKRLRAYSRMVPPLQQEARRLEAILSQQATRDQLRRHQIGLALDPIMADEAYYGTYAVSQLAGYMGIPADALYKLRTFAQAFPAEQVEGMAQQAMPNGGTLSYNHFLVAMTLRHSADRQLVLELALRESLTVRELRQAVKDGGYLKDRPGTSTGRRPTSLLDGLRQMQRRLKVIQESFPLWQEIVLHTLTETASTELDPAAKALLAPVADTLESLAEQCNAAASLLRVPAKSHTALGAAAKESKGSIV